MNKQKILILALATLLLAGAGASAETPVSAGRQLSNDQIIKAHHADNSFLRLRVSFSERSSNGFMNYSMNLLGSGDVGNVQADCSVFYRKDEWERIFLRADFLGLSPENQTISSPWFWIGKSSRVEGVLLRLSRRNMHGELVVREFEEGRVPSENERAKYRVDRLIRK